MKGDLIHLDHRPIGFKRKAMPDHSEFPNRSHDFRSCAGSPDLGIGGKPPFLEPFKKLLLGPGNRSIKTRFKSSEPIEDSRETPPGHDIGVKLLE